MHFLDDSLLPENQEKLVIQVAPYGPEWLPGDSDDIPVTMDEQVQKAVDCYNAGAQLLHIHVRELDGRGSKRLSMFNEMLARLREAVPEMILQVGGSISFAPENEGDTAKWLDNDTRHLLADLSPAPDQVTIAINTNQMNVVELLTRDDIAGTSMQNPQLYKAYRDLVSEAGPEFYLEHLKRLTANGIQPHFMLGNLPSLETVERLIRAGVYTGPLNLNYVAIGGGASGVHPADLIEFARRSPDGAVLTVESIMRSTLPMNTIALALGLHVRVGIEDNLWAPRKERITSVQQVEQIVRIADELGRDVASAQEAKQIYRIGEYWSTSDETLAHLGLPPNRRAGERGVPLRHRAPAVPAGRPSVQASGTTGATVESPTPPARALV
ncbi:3-keto-5-aminohexanoate cleavage protein [Streptomyces sp. RS10V-4]|uniref:3-keto-5-aminohexanoate cleavage protein n=1 Tax=Streptomyces rhizoryzae TaxID=2932493 RepID=UPI0020066BAA|nr:3-keto-5-aminohexanoate cleavage protein [Streptomyces rhizoryzae]MCK7621638.1 3-keto-5-aminohexanoate cleavage protein [Streptomyces rhizoryzae]